MKTKIINRQYRYLIKPTITQKEEMNRIFDATRLVQNRFVQDKKEGLIKTKFAKDILSRYKQDMPFLDEIETSALMNTLFTALDNKKVIGRIKKKSDGRQSFTLSNLMMRPIYLTKSGYLHLPCIGDVQIVLHRNPPGNSEIRKVSIVRSEDGKYHAGITYAIRHECPEIELDFNKSVGLDYSSTYFYVDNNGNRACMPHFFKEREKRIARIDKAISMCKKGSNNYYKNRVKRAKEYAKIKNRRTDYLHKLSTEMAEKYDFICIESLNLIETSQKFKLGKRTLDNAFRTFVDMLEYKLEERGKKLLKVDKYFPSSKTCSCCGSINDYLTIDDKKWKCTICNTEHDRDINAANNIRNKCINDYYGRRVFG